ncbi:hypothetical protein HS125_07575 [bacterium]|nr:hypothetical protein [bacterium]
MMAPFTADGFGPLLLFLLVVGGALADAWSKRRQELQRRKSLSQEQRQAAERRPESVETRSVVMEEKRPPLGEPVPPRSLPQSAQTEETEAPPVEDPLREIARRLGIPEEILPPPPRGMAEVPREPVAPRPKPKPRPQPAMPRPEPAAATVAEVPAAPAEPRRPRRLRIRQERPAAPARPPLVFHDDPVINAIIVHEVLLTPRQRSLLRRSRRA